MNLLEKEELAVLDEVDSENLEVREAFVVDDLEKANWAFKKISALSSRIKEKEDLAAIERERIATWLEKETISDKQSIDYFNSLLSGYYRELRRTDPKAKLTTPYGKVTSRKMQPKWEFNEEEAILYFKNNDMNELVTVKESIDKTKAKKVFNIVQSENQVKVVDENGEVVNFATVIPQDDSITVKVD